MQSGVAVGPEYPAIETAAASPQQAQVDRVRRALLGIPAEAKPVPWTYEGERMLAVDYPIGDARVFERRLYTLKHGELARQDLKGRTTYSVDRSTSAWSAAGKRRGCPRRSTSCRMGSTSPSTLCSRSGPIAQRSTSPGCNAGAPMHTALHISLTILAGIAAGIGWAAFCNWHWNRQIRKDHEREQERRRKALEALSPFTGQRTPEMQAEDLVARLNGVPIDAVRCSASYEGGPVYSRPPAIEGAMPSCFAMNGDNISIVMYCTLLYTSHHHDLDDSVQADLSYLNAD